MAKILIAENYLECRKAVFFSDFVERISPTGCWLPRKMRENPRTMPFFCSGISHSGYTTIGKFAWFLIEGEMPTNRALEWLCDMANCVSPYHAWDPTPEERFISFIRVGRPQDCWPWIGAVDLDGYGSYRLMGNQTHASRIAYLVFVGQPGEKLVLHSCDNPPCCNPSHLFLGTTEDNILDKVLKARTERGSNRYNATRTEDEVSNLRKIFLQLKAGGHKQQGIYKKVAEIAGVAYNASLCDLLRGKRWKHVPWPES